MQFTLAILSALAAASAVAAQGVTAVLTPPSPAPSGCSSSFSGTFEITVVLPSMKRDIQRRDNCGAAGVLVATLSGGVLHDAVGRIGAIVANRQFQFDGPPAQAGSIYTAGWSVCSNGSLALGGSAVFYQCLSGTFYNLYDQSIGGQCQPVLIAALPCGTVAQLSDGQPTGASATQKVTQISDGQVQASSAVSMMPVSQYTDGQLQATAKATVAITQISDGQIQASAAATPKPTTMSTTSTPVVISQISDGQIQASASPASTTPATAPPVSTTPTPTIASVTTTSTKPAASVFTGAAAVPNVGSQIALGAAALAALAMF